MIIETIWKENRTSAIPINAWSQARFWLLCASSEPPIARKDAIITRTSATEEARLADQKISACNRVLRETFGPGNIASSSPSLASDSEKLLTASLNAFSASLGSDSLDVSALGGVPCVSVPTANAWWWSGASPIKRQMIRAVSLDSH